MFSRLVKQIAEKQGITETLKATNQMAWIKRVNNLYAQADENVNNDLMYGDKLLILEATRRNGSRRFCFLSCIY